MNDTTNSKTGASPVARVSALSSNKYILGAGIVGVLLCVIGFSSCGHRLEGQKADNNISKVPVIAAAPPQIELPHKHNINAAMVAKLAQGPTDTDRKHDMVEQAQKLLQMRQLAPSQVYSADSSDTSSSNSKIIPQTDKVNADPNSQFMANLAASNTETETATRIKHPSTTIAQGGIINATLESRIVSDLPGMVRAIAAEDVYSQDGSQLLLPRGSRLIGQYNNAIQQGQKRVFVVWQRLIRPDNIDIQLNSPGTDPLGAAGLNADNIDHHFFEQFGMAALLSIIGAGTATAGVSPSDRFNSASAYREALAASLNSTAKKTLDIQGVIAPSLYINQGTKISVFIARDLDFYQQLNQGKPA